MLIRVRKAILHFSCSFVGFTYSAHRPWRSHFPSQGIQPQSEQGLFTSVHMISLRRYAQVIAVKIRSKCSCILLIRSRGARYCRAKSSATLLSLGCCPLLLGAHPKASYSRQGFLASSSNADPTFTSGKATALLMSFSGLVQHVLPGVRRSHHSMRVLKSRAGGSFSLSG